MDKKPFSLTYKAGVTTLVFRDSKGNSLSQQVDTREVTSWLAILSAIYDSGFHEGKRSVVSDIVSKWFEDDKDMGYTLPDA